MFVNLSVSTKSADMAPEPIKPQLGGRLFGCFSDIVFLTLSGQTVAKK